jgi:hypothetical protein
VEKILIEHSAAGSQRIKIGRAGNFGKMRFKKLIGRIDSAHKNGGARTKSLILSNGDWYVRNNSELVAATVATAAASAVHCI